MIYLSHCKVVELYTLRTMALPKVLVVLPTKFDRHEGSLIDGKEYEMHYLEISEEAKETILSVDYVNHLRKPGTITSYMDRAVEYVKDQGINGVIAGHDLASIVGASVSERCGLPGPSAESMFLCFHKYYSRKAERPRLWFDYILLDSSSNKEEWRRKVQYPCFVKTPFLQGADGSFCVRSEEEMENSLTNLRQYTAPYFAVFKELFEACIDVQKYPLAVQNVVVVEELVENADLHTIDGWFDDKGKYSLYIPGDEVYYSERKHTPFAWIVPSRLSVEMLKKVSDFCQEVGRKFDMRNTFCSIEIWRRGSHMELLEVNGRLTYTLTYLYREMWPACIVHRSAAQLACGTPDKVVNPTFDNKIGGQFLVFTYGEGMATEFLNFAYLREECKSDGAISHNGPGAEILARENTNIKQSASSGKLIVRFGMYDTNYEDLVIKAKALIDKAILKPELSPVL